MEQSLTLDGYHPDDHDDAAVSFHVRVTAHEQEIPLHHHRKGQLILALHGGITCEVADAMWMVPPQYAVWIPGAMPHHNRATANARLCFLFIEPGAVAMPEQCCTLKVTPFVRELIVKLAACRERSERRDRLVQVLFDELPELPVEPLRLPVSAHPKIRTMVEFMAAHPQQNRTLAQWATQLAMSERNLSRLIVRETGLNYRRWRHQLQLIQALQMLVDGMNVQQVAQGLGYDSTTAFITMFKKGLGQTPGRYLDVL